MDDGIDRDLIQRHQAGDPAAFEVLATRWNDRLVDLAFRLTGDAEEARDIRQLALLRMTRALDRFNPAAPFSTWIYRVVANLCIDRRRADDARRRHETSAASRRGTIADPADDARREVHDTVARAVGALAAADRIVVALKHYQGLTFDEIARVLDCPPSTVKTRMSRALAALRPRLARIRPDEE